MRGKLVAHDVVECVLGLGPNLFYNSPMEACVVVCRTTKPAKRRNRVLFINAVNEVTRERAQSFFSDEHLDRIVKAYQGFKDIEGFAKVVDNTEIREKGDNLSIPLYVRPENSREENGSQGPEMTVKQAIKEWQASSKALRTSMSELFKTLEQDIVN